MSSLWTPDGERPVSPRPTAAGPDPDGPTPEQVAAMSEELRQFQEEILAVDAGEIVANHCIGLFQLAAVHLQVEPPDLAQAAVAIDAFRGIVERCAGRLGRDEATVRQALDTAQMLFIQVAGPAAP